MLPQAGEVHLRIFNMLGAEVRMLVAAIKVAGMHKARWDGKDGNGKLLPSGVYFYWLEVESRTTNSANVILNRKLVLLY